jgi:hypothetical protein
MRGQPLQRASEIIAIICGSNQRYTQFTEIISAGNASHLFCTDAGEVIQLPEVGLISNVKTCWDSVYYMHNRLRVLHLVRLHPGTFLWWTKLLI